MQLEGRARLPCLQGCEPPAPSASAAPLPQPMQKPLLIAAEQPISKNTAARSTSPKFSQPIKNRRPQPAQKTPSRAMVAKNTDHSQPLFCFLLSLVLAHTASASLLYFVYLMTCLMFIYSVLPKTARVECNQYVFCQDMGLRPAE